MASVDFHTAWAAELARLELDVVLAERVVAVDHLPGIDEVARLRAWAPPSGLGPLPASLTDRARALLDRQRAAAGALARAMTVNRRQLAALEAVRPAPARPPVFCDLEA